LVPEIEESLYLELRQTVAETVMDWNYFLTCVDFGAILGFGGWTGVVGAVVSDDGILGGVGGFEHLLLCGSFGSRRD